MRLANHHRAYTMHNMKLQAELALVVNALNNSQIPVIVLKGLYLASCVYEQVGQREMDDVDLLIPENSLHAAREVLITLGYTGPEPSDISVLKKYYHHLPPLTKSGTICVELHWNIANPGNNDSIKPDELWSRAERIKIAEADLWTLCPEDVLLHLCLHTSYQHQFAFGLRPFCDIATVIASPDISIDWEAVVSRSVRLNWKRGTYLSLKLAQILSGAQVPQSVLQALKPANFDESLCIIAQSLICTRQAFAVSIKPNIVQLTESNSYISKVRRILKSIFIPRDQLALHYNLPQGSLRAYLYYPVRLIYLIREHSAVLKGLVKPAENVKLLAQRKHQLAQWLSEEP